ncbi:MAG TPA: ATP-binding protein [Chitinophagales bacterium]|nr:ATP-binding protein [Chitinophagales bacterium]
MKSADYIRLRNEFIDMKVETFQQVEKTAIYEKLQRIEEEAAHRKDWNFLLSIYKFLMSAHFTKNDFGNSLQYCFKAISLLENHPDTIKELVFYSTVIQCYQQLGNYETAQVYVNRAIELSLQINNADRIAAAYYNASLQYEFLHNKDGQKDSLMRCIEYAKKATHKRVLGFAYANISVVYKTEENYQKSNQYLVLAEAIAREIKNNPLLAFVFTQKAILLSLQKKYKNALASIDDALSILFKLDERTQYIESSIEKIKILLQLKRYDDGLKFIKPLLKRAKNDRIKTLHLQLLSLQHQLLAKQHKTKEAYTVLIRYTTLNEELFNEASDKRIKNLEITHQVHQIKKEKESAEKIAKLKHDFLANMSHEIRTPINNIMGLSFLLQEEDNKKKQSDYALRIHKSSENLLALINDILDVSKIEAGKFELHETIFSMQQLIENIKNTVQQKADEKGLQIIIRNKLQQDFYVGDALRLQQILLNIIYNAVKFTNKGSVIFTLQKSKDNKTEFIIADTGIGIKKDKLNAVFAEYEQASTSIKSNFGGTGLGLSISKKLIDLMHGTIEVKSKINKGTTFAISIPIKESERKNGFKKTALITKKTATRFSALHNIEIYFADDNEDNRKILTEIVAHFNTTVKIKSFENGKQLLDALKFTKKLPSLVITDIDMPMMNGLELIAAIKNHQKLKQLKVIATTSSLLLNEKEDVLALGFDALLQNPVPPTELVENIVSLLRK